MKQKTPTLTLSLALLVFAAKPAAANPDGFSLGSVLNEITSTAQQGLSDLNNLIGGLLGGGNNPTLGGGGALNLITPETLADEGMEAAEMLSETSGIPMQFAEQIIEAGVLSEEASNVASGVSTEEAQQAAVDSADAIQESVSVTAPDLVGQIETSAQDIEQIAQSAPTTTLTALQMALDQQAVLGRQNADLSSLIQQSIAIGGESAAAAIEQRTQTAQLLEQQAQMNKMAVRAEVSTLQERATRANVFFPPVFRAQN